MPAFGALGQKRAIWVSGGRVCASFRRCVMLSYSEILNQRPGSPPVLHPTHPIHPGKRAASEIL